MASAPEPPRLPARTDEADSPIRAARDCAQ